MLKASFKVEKTQPTCSITKPKLKTKGAIMKTATLIMAVALATISATESRAQGTISFQNTSSTLVTYSLDGINFYTVPTGAGVKVQLAYLPKTGSTAPLLPTIGSLNDWELVGTPGNIGPVAGRFGAFSDTTGNDVAPGGNVWLVAIGWTGGFTSYSAAISGLATMNGNTLTTAPLFSVSQIWSQGTGDGGSVPAVSSAGLFPGLLLAVPEPSTIALGGLGAAALLLFRRRK